MLKFMNQCQKLDVSVVSNFIFQHENNFCTVVTGIHRLVHVRSILGNNVTNNNEKYVSLLYICHRIAIFKQNLPSKIKMEEKKYVHICK